MSLTDSPQDVITTREAAQLLGVSVRTIQLWVENGVFRAWKTAGGHRRIARESVLGFLRERQGEENPAAQKNGARSELTILIVDDDEHLTKLYRHQISAIGLPAKVLTALNGFSGLLQIGRSLPDIVVADLLMPGMDGFRMIRAIKGDPDLDQVKVVVATGLSEEEVRDHGGLPDGVEVWRKPISLSQLEKLIRSRMEEKSPREA